MAYDTANDAYEQNKILFEAGAISKTALNQSTAQKETARIAYQGAATALNNQENKTSILSPSEGIVTGISVSVGENLSIGTPVISIADLRQLILKGIVTEDQISKLKTGQTVKVTIGSLNKKVAGKITFISPVNATGTRSFPVEITIDNGKGEFSAGMSAGAVL